MDVWDAVCDADAVHTAAKPHIEWSAIEDGVMQAGNLALSCAKFDGKHTLLQKWLCKNRPTLTLAGFPVDDRLASWPAGW